MLTTLSRPEILDLLEQAGGTYWATILDDEAQPIFGNQLNTLSLTLYVVRADGSVAILNSRDHLSALNANNVEVFNTLQTRSDGLTYNLRWRIQVGDTTLFDALPFERHIALFEWTWPRPVGGTGVGKHEVVLNVRNLTEVGI